MDMLDFTNELLRNIANSNNLNLPKRTDVDSFGGLVHYKYRHSDGRNFECFKPTIEDCIQAKREWLEKGSDF